MGKNENVKNVNINEMKEFINDKKLANVAFHNYDSKVLIGLYNTYCKAVKLENCNYNLDEFENKIYFVNGKVMSNKAKIKYEMNIINKKLMSERDLEIRETVKGNLEYLYNICDDNCTDDYDENLAFYMKKEISCMQAALGMNLTFFKAAKEAFLEENRNIKLMYTKKRKRVDK